MRIEVIVPKGVMFDIEKFKYRNKISSMRVAREAKRQFEKTTMTWSRRPKFYIKDELSSDYLEIGTNDDLYVMINDGVPRHVIMPKYAKRMRFQRGYKPKTTPGYIGSSSGGKFGDYVNAQFVWHPGIDPRRFAEEISIITGEMFIRLKIGDVVEANR